VERERQARWDAAHLVSLGTKLRERQAARLWTLCALEGVSVYALLRRLVLAWMEETEQRMTAETETARCGEQGE